MTKKALLLLVFLLLILHSASFGQNHERLFVWNMNGTELKKAPTQLSATLKKFSLAEEINYTLLSSDAITTTQATNSGYGITGEWLRVVNQNDTGYIFNCDLSNKKPPTTTHAVGLVIDYNSLLGAKISDTSYIELAEIDNNIYEVEIKVEIFENGSYSLNYFDGCFDHEYIFKDVSFDEIFHVTMSMYSSYLGNEKSIPTFMEEQMGEIRFWGVEATVEVIIRKSEDNWQIFSYDCD